MKSFEWDSEKDEFLKRTRGVGFEEVVFWIESGNLLSIEENPSGNFENQKIMIVDIKDYANVVPFVEGEDHIFLKTIFPSRQATKKYLR